jgi:hypothetical protein
MYRMFPAALVAATMAGGAILAPSGAAAATVSAGVPEATTARMELIQYRGDDDDRWDRRRGGYDRDDDYDRPRRWRPPHHGGGYGIHPRRVCSWRERRAWTPYGWRWRPVRVCRTIYW